MLRKFLPGYAKALSGAFAFLLGASSLFAQNGKAIVHRGDRLEGRAVLPAATFLKGVHQESTLAKLPINGQSIPFINKQPVQGVSALIENGDGTYMGLSDNGYGSIENSADYNLRIYHLEPHFKETQSDSGSIAVLGYIELRDPNHQIPFAITNHFTEERVLTGADLDVESLERTEDGSLWLGDEFGPFLLHFDSTGILLEPPFVLPDFENPGKDLRAPQNPFNEEISALRVMNASAAMQKNLEALNPLFLVHGTL